MSKQTGQRDRLAGLAVYAAAIIGANWWITGNALPATDGHGLWMYGALLSLILGNQLLAPYFTKPVDALASSLAALVSVYSVQQWAAWDQLVRTSYLLLLVYYFIVLVAAFLAISFKDAKGELGRRLAQSSWIVAANLGDHRPVFGSLVIFSLLAFHAQSAAEIGTIGFVWILTSIVRPLDVLAHLGARLSVVWSGRPQPSIVGEIIAYQTPGLVLAKQRGSLHTTAGSPVVIRDPHGPSRLGVALGHVGRDNALLLRVIELPMSRKAQEFCDSVAAGLPTGVIAEVTQQQVQGATEAPGDYWLDTSRCVGIVAPDTTTSRLYFEVVGEEPLVEGDLVEVVVRGKTVLYQVLDGLTKEDIVHQKNTYGYARALGKKIGCWDSEKRRFAHAAWLPQLNTPVYRHATEQTPPEYASVGHFPGTGYPVCIRDIHQLVTHNTAILGVLGVGKSMLAIELVERMLLEEIKVVCLDLTDQYAKELSEYLDPEQDEMRDARIREASERDKEKFAENPQDGGSLPNLAEAIADDLRGFLEDGKRLLRVYNPSELVATKQLTEPRSYNNGKEWKRSAALWAATPVEVTQIVAETVLRLLQTRMSDRARLCLVLEEAHALVPEFSSVVADGDRHATNGTARAILQGRKYGLGCLLITQRTANVTKTILNQCNSVFAMRTFDDTARSFLSNYIGSDYADILPTLEERHAVFYGRASSCENPVLIRLNDRDWFQQLVRQKLADEAVEAGVLAEEESTRKL